MPIKASDPCPMGPIYDPTGPALGSRQAPPFRAHEWRIAAMSGGGEDAGWTIAYCVHCLLRYSDPNALEDAHREIIEHAEVE